MSRLYQISNCENASRKADIVFVHGLGGDALETWRHGTDQATSWPHWIGAEFPEVAVWSLGFAASPSSLAKLLRLVGLGSRDSGYSMPLPDRAVQVLDLMVQKGLGARPIMFVCHSLGGILTKQLVRTSADSPDAGRRALSQQTRGILFLATPHAGAALASLASSFRTVLGTTVSLHELREHDAHLRDLSNWYRNNAPKLGIETASYFEQRSVKGVVPIVNPTSAHPGVGSDPVALDEDHISIAKPRERDAQVCGAVRHLLRTCVIVARRNKLADTLRDSGAWMPSHAPQELIFRVEENRPQASASPRIPREMPPAAGRFFGRAVQKELLVQRLQAGLSTAVVGSAGMGKTALAADALSSVVGKNASDVVGSPYPDGLVYLDLYAFHGQADPTWNSLANRICGPAFMDRFPARDRATEACRSRRLLIIIEGGEEVDGSDARPTISQLLSVLSQECRWLLLTRLTTQAAPEHSVYLRETLGPDDAAALFDSLTQDVKIDLSVRRAVMELLEGHPLALNWAGNFIAKDEEDPARLVAEWRSDHLPKLSNPREGERTLHWIFARSVRGLGEQTRQVLSAAGCLAGAPFSQGPILAAVMFHDPKHATRDVLDSIRSLIQRGLLRRVDSDHWQFTHALAYRFAREDGANKSEQASRIADWLGETLQTRLSAGVPSDMLSGVATLLQHAAAVLRADKRQQMWEILAKKLLYEISDRLEQVGRLDLVGSALTAVSDWFAQMPESVAMEPRWLGEKCVLIDDRGDMLRDQGDLAGAIGAYRESHGIRQALQNLQPSYLPWQRGLSVSQNKMGVVLRDQGDLPAALATYSEALDTFRRLAERDASSPDRKRDLSVGLLRVGDVLLEQEEFDTAYDAFAEALVIRQRMVEEYPENTQFLRDLSVCQERIGDVLYARKDLGGAKRIHEASLLVRRQLLDGDQSNAGFHRDVSTCLDRIGKILRDQNDYPGAHAAFSDSLAMTRRIAETDPSNARFQRGLSAALTRMAQLYEVQGKAKEGLPLAEESLGIDERLSALDPSNMTWKNDVIVSRSLVSSLRSQAIASADDVN